MNSNSLEESVSLHYTNGTNSDKVYIIRLEEVAPNRFTVTGFNGKRGGTLTTQKKTPNPVSYEQAKAIFNALEAKKRNDPRNPYTVTDRTEGNSSAPIRNTPARMPKPSNYEPTGFVAIHPKKVTEDEARRLLHNEDYVAEQKLDGEFLSIRLGSNSRVTASNKRGKGILVPPKLTNAIRQLANVSGCEVSLGLAGEYLDSTLHVFAVWEKNGTSLLALPQHLRVALKDKLASQLADSLLTSNNKTTFPIKFVYTAQTEEEKAALYDRVKDSDGEGVVFKHRESDLSFKFKLYETTEVLLNANAKRSAECFAYHGDTLISLGSTTIPSEAVYEKVKEANLKDEPIVASVKYLYLSAPPVTGTASGQLTQASFIRFRPEYQPTDCTTNDLKVVNKTVHDTPANPSDIPPPVLPPPPTQPLEPEPAPSRPQPTPLANNSAATPPPPTTLFAL